MTLSEAISTGLSTTVVGLSIVFSVLIILMIVLKIMEKIFTAAPKEKPVAAVQETKTVEEVSETTEEYDNDELIAVLTAAIAASLNTSTYNLKIKSFKRVQSNATTWQKAGIRETINSRL